MKPRPIFTLLNIMLTLASTVRSEGPTGSPFYGDAPDEHHPWAIHDQNRPQPKLVTPGSFSTPEKPGQPPSDAIILFGGSEADLAKWVSDKKPDEGTKWIVKDGAFQCVPGSGYVRSKEEFGDCQLHIEWAAPAEVKGDSQGRGNSGVFLMGKMEVQVLDNYNNPSYADGMASSVYGVNPPLANALRPPGVFQVYDIIFRRPVYDGNKVLDPGYVTVFVNGVLTQDHTQIEGGTGHKSRTVPGPFPEKGPLKLQDHGNPVRYRNIWYRPLPPRSVEGGTDGPLSAEATTAKRKEIAKTIRDDAAKLQGEAKLLRQLESLTYEADAVTLAETEKSATAFLDEVSKTSADKIESHKGQVMVLDNALKYLAKFNRIPGTFAPKAAASKIVTEQEWDKDKKERKGKKK